jgi:SAM-dependent methyltransferase
MSHQDFELYATQRPHIRDVSDVYRRFFSKHLGKLSSDARVLDFGCGHGIYYSFFSEYFNQANIYGVEVSVKRVAYCKSIGWENVHYLPILSPLPFTNEMFDVVHCDQVIEHIPKKEIGFYIKELHRVLKKDGKMVFITPNYPIKRLYDIYNAISKRDITRVKDDPTHVARYDFKRLVNVFQPDFSVILEPTGGRFWNRLPYNFFSHKIIGLVQKRQEVVE